MTNRTPPCANCDSTGWVSYEVPGAMIDGAMHMRQRINPCHLCNAGGSWKQWAQNVVDGAGEQAKVTGETK